MSPRIVPWIIARKGHPSHSLVTGVGIDGSTSFFCYSSDFPSGQALQRHFLLPSPHFFLKDLDESKGSAAQEDLNP